MVDVDGGVQASWSAEAGITVTEARTAKASTEEKVARA